MVGRRPVTDGKGAAPGLGEGYEADAGDGRHGISGIRWGEEWSAGYERRPARWGQRWSWQNRGGYVDEMGEATSADVDRTEINRATVVAALEEWIVATHASQMGRTFGVSQPAGRRAYAEHLLDGPVAAVLDKLGFAVV